MPAPDGSFHTRLRVKDNIIVHFDHFDIFKFKSPIIKLSLHSKCKWHPPLLIKIKYRDLTHYQGNTQQENI